MSRPDAFFIAPDAFAEPFALTGGEANHCARVLRKKAGERLRAFDGQGREGLFTITAVSRDRVDLAPVSLETVTRPAGGIHLAVGFSRSARRDFFLEKAVELGAAGIIFWQSARTQGRMPETPKPSWDAVLVAAAKQCGAAWLPSLTMVPGGAAGLADWGAARFSRRALLWEDADCRDRLTVADLAVPEAPLFVLGPEGGLTEAEVATFREAGFSPVSLGPRILRWETAALAVLALGLAAAPA